MQSFDVQFVGAFLERQSRNGDRRLLPPLPRPGRTASQADDGEVLCTFCGRYRPDAEWHGHGGVVRVCRLCARRVLLRLMARALVGSHADLPALNQYLRLLLDDAISVFWDEVERITKGQAERPPAATPQ